MTRALIVTAGDGAKRRLNPLQVIGWKGGDIGAVGERIVEGTIVILPNGPVGIRESEETFDHLWTVAVNEPGLAPDMRSPGQHVRSPVEET